MDIFPGPSSCLQAPPKIILNVGGEKFELLSWTALNRLPNTRLGKLHSWPKDLISEICDDHCPLINEYFFNRNSKTFSAILSFYYTGKLHCPDGVCVVAFKEDLDYWEIDDGYLDSCCRYRYLQLMEKVQDEKREIDLINRSMEQEENFGRIFVGCRKYLWNLFERPTSSWQGKVVAMISVVSIVASTIVLALNSMPEFLMMECVYENETLCEESLPDGNSTINDNWVVVENYYFALTEEICIAWFTLEYVTRFVVSPNKRNFLKDLFNIFDLLAILPYYIILLIFLETPEPVDTIRRFIQVCRLMRIIRVFKLARHSTGLQSFLFTLRQSHKELQILFLLLVLGIILFSSLAFYAEKHQNQSQAFESIPEAFWWAALTMNVVGLGNLQPISITGKIVSFMCGVCGMLFVGLPIPVIVDNFGNYYNVHKKRLKVVSIYNAEEEQRTKPRLIGIVQHGIGENGIKCEDKVDYLNLNQIEMLKLTMTRRVKVNVGGRTFEFTWNVLEQVPNSRLGQLRTCRDYKSLKQICDDIGENNELYFYRDAKPFSSILNLYFTGRLHLLNETCPVGFDEELQYWMISRGYLQSCCQFRLNQKRDIILREVEEIEELLREVHDDFGHGKLAKWRKFAWYMLEKPGSSKHGKCFGLLSIIITLSSASVITLKTMPEFSDSLTECSPHQPLSSDPCHEVLQESPVFPPIELFSILWFGSEYLLRLLVSPNRLNFLQRKLDTLDPLILASYIISSCLLLYPSTALAHTPGRIFKYFCDILRILRLFRILKLGKQSTALEALGYTLKHSIKHLGVLLLFLAIGVLVFSSLAYIAEREDNPEFESIPTTFWWALVTMHTLSIGNVHTTTLTGKVISFVCGLFGLLFLVLPIPIIASNFNEFYKKQMRLDRAEKKCILLRRNMEDVKVGGKRRVVENQGDNDKDKLQQQQ